MPSEQNYKGTNKSTFSGKLSLILLPARHSGLLGQVYYRNTVPAGLQTPPRVPGERDAPCEPWAELLAQRVPVGNDPS